MDFRNVHQIRIIYAIGTYSRCIDYVYVYVSVKIRTNNV